VSTVISQRQSLMFRARSYMAFVLTARTPIADWLADLDASIERSKGFFSRHPVALDLSAVDLNPDAIVHLVANLSERSIRVLGIEGAKSADADGELPPILRSGRDGLNFELPDHAVVVDSVPAQKQHKMSSMLVEGPVRSGQSVVFTEGDVTVLGPVGSGAEVIAGGSIHIYGPLRGRAIAGINGDARARIFCRRVEAEFLAIDSYYKTADDIADDLRSQPAQAWLEGKMLRISSIN
jgi:septum site-determining protein MinC